MVSVYIRQTLVQIATPDGMRGRVSAVNSLAINASNELGDFRAGPMAGGIGTVPSVLVGGLAKVAIPALCWRLFPSVPRVARPHALRRRLGPRLGAAVGGPLGSESGSAT